MMWRGSRAAVGIRMKGDIAELWQGDHQVGLLFRWTINGFDGKWDGTAQRHRLNPDFNQQEMELRFQIEAIPLELRGYGYIRGGVCDGGTHREPIELKGTRLWVETGIPVPNESS